MPFDVSIVLVNYHCAEQLRECLRSLQPFDDGLRCQLIVVDNSPPDASCHFSQAELSRIELLNPGNIGYAAACNRGLERSLAPYVLFLNPDTRYVCGSARQLIAWLEKQPSIALVGPRVLNPDGSRQFSCRRFPGWTLPFCHRSSLITRLIPGNALSRDYLLPDLDGQCQDVDWASGCCLFTRKEALQQVGGFDESYFLFFEDIDLAYRLKRQGWRCVYYPQLSFLHQIGESRHFLPDYGIKAKHDSVSRYFTKNIIGNRLAGAAFSAMVYLRGYCASGCYRLFRGPLSRPRA